MTSVASEASAISHRPAKTERISRPTGMHGGDGFAALMDIQTRPEPKPAAKPAAPAPARDAAKPAEKAEQGPKSDEAMAAAAPSDANQAAPVEGAEDETISDVAATAVTDGAPDLQPEPVATTIAAAPAPELPAVAAPAVAAAIPPQAAPAPETAAPEDADSLQTAAPNVPASAPTPPAPKPVTPDEAAQTSDQAEQASAQPRAQAKASATPADGKSDEASPEAPKEMAAQPETPQAPGPKQTKELPAQAAPVRPDAVTGKSTTRPDFVVKTEDPAAPAKPAVDLTAQFATPAHAAHPAATSAATPHAAPASAAQPVPVNALAVEIAAQARAGNSRFEIRLDPPELGRIDVRLDVDRDGNVSSRLVIERADTYDLLRRDQSTLERALQQAGLKTSDNALEFSLRDQGFAQHRSSDDLPRGLQAVVQEAETTPGEAANGYARLLGTRGGIDIRV